MNEGLKPCVNNMCVCYSLLNHLFCKLHKTRNANIAKEVDKIWTKAVLRCEKYITEKPESAWEMFRRLRGQIKSNTIKICISLCDPIDVKSCGQRTNPIEVIDCLFMQDEQKARNVMKEYEKELINE